MFGLITKSVEQEREEERRNRDKLKEKEELKRSVKSLTSEELSRLEEAKRSLNRKFSNNTQGVPTDNGGDQNRNTISPVKGNSFRTTRRNLQTESNVIGSLTKQESSKLARSAPPTRPKPIQKKGVLKDKVGSLEDQSPVQTIHLNRSFDVATLSTENSASSTMASESEGGIVKATQISSVKSAVRAFEKPAVTTAALRSLWSSPPESKSGPPANVSINAKTSVKMSVSPVSPLRMTTKNGGKMSPPVSTGLVVPLSPVEKSYGIDLQLPLITPPSPLLPREVIVRRQTSGDFGFALRKSSIADRRQEAATGSEAKRTIILAEPGPKNRDCGLFPGDRIIEVDGMNVEDMSRENIIGLIRKAGERVLLKVQPIAELSELSTRSSINGELPIQHVQAAAPSLDRNTPENQHQSTCQVITVNATRR